MIYESKLNLIITSYGASEIIANLFPVNSSTMTRVNNYSSYECPVTLGSFVPGDILFHY